MATVRRELLIHHPADDVWALLADPGSLDQWYPGITACSYEPSSEPGIIGVRTVTTGTGLTLTEEIITLDPLLRRMQYRIAGGLIKHHLSTIDVIALADQSCLAVYGTDAEPAVMALVLGGASGDGLKNVSTILDNRSNRDN